MNTSTESSWNHKGSTEAEELLDVALEGLGRGCNYADPIPIHVGDTTFHVVATKPGPVI